MIGNLTKEELVAMVKANGSKTKDKHLDYVTPLIEENDVIVDAWVSSYTNDPNDDKNRNFHNDVLFILTETRLIFGKQRLMGGGIMKALELTEFRDMSFIRPGIMFQYLVLEAITERVAMVTTKEVATQRMQVIRDLIKKQNAPEPQKVATLSVADELLKFKQLLDMGAISEEEYEEQKRVLLGK